MAEKNNGQQEIGDKLGVSDSDIQKDYKNDVEDFQSQKPQKVSFPLGTFAVACLNEIVNILSLGLIGVVFNFISWLVIKIYMAKRPKFVKDKMYQSYLISFLFEFIPLINLFPFWIRYVLRAYATEKLYYSRLSKIIEGKMAAAKKNKE